MVQSKKNIVRLVAKSYVQYSSIDYKETFSCVACLDTIRALISLVAQKEWKFYN